MPIELGETARDPLVPAGDENEARVFLERALPLLGHIQSVAHRVRARVGGAVMEAAAVRAGFAHRAEPAVDGVLRRRRRTSAPSARPNW